MNLSALANTLEGDLGGRKDPPPKRFFIPSRYPYTYAYDWLRISTNVGERYSRGEIAGFVKKFCANYGVSDEDRERLITVFADRYLAKFGIEKT